MQKLKERHQELDQLMNSLSGVLAAKTVIEEDTITDIHILSDSTKSPKQLVRDVQSAVMASLGMSIDYRLISIAQVDKNLVVPIEDLPMPDVRLEIAKISTSLENNSLETIVVLQNGNMSFQGSSRSSLSNRNAARSAANACVAALHQYLGVDCQLLLLDLQHQTLAGQPCLTAALSLSMDHKEGLFFGIAPIQSPDLEVQAAAMAVLSSMNRPLGKSNCP